MKVHKAKETDRVEEKFYIWFVLLIAISLSPIIYYTIDEYYPEWVSYQEKYIEMQTERSAADRKEFVLATPLKVRQIWLPKWNRADRCVTCHMGVDNPLMVGEENPYKAHPILTKNGWKKTYSLDEYKKRLRHDFPVFGCTICHEGQGRATTKLDAHGMENLYDPYTESEANERGILRPMLPVEITQASCGKCHDPKDRFPGAPELMRGQALAEEYECIGCHTIKKEGGKDGPELTTAGTKFYNNARGGIHNKRFQSRRFGFLYESLLDPSANIDDSIMAAAVELSEEEAATIVVYLLSLQEPISLYNASMDRMIQLPGYRETEKESVEGS